MATTSADRILSLDIIRGIAVMGIFSVNVVGMAMIESAYFYPPAFGLEGLGDRIMWAGNFLVVDGRFRSLFSILFGASMVLVVERAVAQGKNGVLVHIPRMMVLLLFGLAHYYFLWWGDILANYALVGMIAYAFWRLETRWLLVASAIVLSLTYVPSIVDGTIRLATWAQTATANDRVTNDDRVGPGPDERLTTEMREGKLAHATPASHLVSMLEHAPWDPFTSVREYGLETLGLILLGMAGYKSGFLTGRWSRRRYAQIMAGTLIPSFMYYGFVVQQTLRTDFAQELYWPWAWMLPTFLHPTAAMGYAAAIMLLVRRGALADRFGAVGRAAFTNYLGATLIGTVLFFGFGFGLFGELSRGQTWLVVPPVWALMLVWSKWWLDRFRYGPLEWAWRSLSRWKWEPMRKQTPTAWPEAA